MKQGIMLKFVIIVISCNQDHNREGRENII